MLCYLTTVPAKTQLRRDQSDHRKQLFSKQNIHFSHNLFKINGYIQTFQEELVAFIDNGNSIKLSFVNCCRQWNICCFFFSYQICPVQAFIFRTTSCLIKLNFMMWRSSDSADIAISQMFFSFVVWFWGSVKCMCCFPTAGIS